MGEEMFQLKIIKILKGINQIELQGSWHICMSINNEKWKIKLISILL